ncbi:NADH-quinone oxidoreductase subunit J [Leptolyngbya sp. 15MV]|nr:NADH-quinone oxidoreductase subunit J [Leptolyngbya sp. 15MV]
MVNPMLFYTLLALGGLGVCLALPRRTLNLQFVGGLVAGAAAGLAILLLSLQAGREQLPNLYFYVFGVLALGGALRVITHPKPVYAALYFVLTILATAGLFVLLSAEFLAFALIIVYAGAILITYLFVIMLATQAPVEGQEEVTPVYDTVAREPVAATAAGFVLLAVLTTMMFRGLGEPMPAPADQRSRDALLAVMPGKIEKSLRDAGLMGPGDVLARNETTGQWLFDLDAGVIEVVSRQGEVRRIPREEWPSTLATGNVEGVAWSLLAQHPGTIEIAGVILLMAMLGAVVLARKQVQIDEEAKARHAARLDGRSEAEGIA